MFMIKYGDRIGFPSAWYTVDDVVNTTVAEVVPEDFVTDYGLMIPIGAMRGNPERIFRKPKVDPLYGNALCGAYVRITSAGNIYQESFYIDTDVDVNQYLLGDVVLPRHSNYVVVEGGENSFKQNFEASLRTLVMTADSFEELEKELPLITSVGSGMIWMTMDEIITMTLKNYSKNLTFCHDTDIVPYDPEKDILIHHTVRISGGTAIFLVEDKVVMFPDILRANKQNVEGKPIPLGYIKGDQKYLFGLNQHDMIEELIMNPKE